MHLRPTSKLGYLSFKLVSISDEGSLLKIMLSDASKLASTLYIFS